MGDGIIVKSSLTNLGHLAEFFKVSRDEIEEGQLVKVLCSLVCHFYNLKNNVHRCKIIN